MKAMADDYPERIEVNNGGTVCNQAAVQHIQFLNDSCVSGHVG